MIFWGKRQKFEVKQQKLSLLLGNFLCKCFPSESDNKTFLFKINQKIETHATLIQVLIVTKHPRQRGKRFRLSWHVSNDHR